MADRAFITPVSRRAILAGGTVLAGGAIAAPGLSAGAAGTPGSLSGPLSDPPSGPLSDGASGPDADLLRLIARAGRRWRDYEATRAAWRRGFDAMIGHPDYPDMLRLPQGTGAARAAWVHLAARTGYAAAAERRDTAHARFIAAAHTAFAIPARTLRGLHAKLSLAAAVAREDCDPDSGAWDLLRRTLDDLERLAAA